MDIITRKEALERGLKRYFTGKSCKHDHIDEKFTADYSCTVCTANRTKKYNEDNASEMKVSRAEYNKQYRAENTDYYREYAKQYQEDNSEYFQEYRKEYRARTIDERKRYDAEYSQANPEKIAARNAKRRAAKLNRTPQWLTAEDTQRVADIYKESARLTELTGIPFHVDHIIPLQGTTVSGFHHPDNLQILPFYENLSKSNKWET